MDKKISVVINTLNEAKNIERALKSVKWADEILVCDMYSEDETAKLAKNFGANVIFHKKEAYVELARNFAISKASNDWILVLDPDEEVPESLRDRLLEIASKIQHVDYVNIARKNIIFGHFMTASMWWPDYNIRFFKKGKVKWTNKIHRPPQTQGGGLNLPSEEKWAIIHHSYNNISQYITRIDRYTQIQANELIKQGYKFNWADLINQPLGEFLSRFFANQGYKDGMHGLALSLLQAFSFLLVYLKVWEGARFKEQNLNLKEFAEEVRLRGKDINYWVNRSKGNSLKSFLKLFK